MVGGVGGVHLWDLSGCQIHTSAVCEFWSVARTAIPFTKAMCFAILPGIRFRPTRGMYLLLSNLTLLEDWYSSYSYGKSENSSLYGLRERQRQIYCVCQYTLLKKMSIGRSNRNYSNGNKELTPWGGVFRKPTVTQLDKTSRRLWNLKVYCRAHNNMLLLFPFLSQMDPFRSHSFHLFKIHYNLMLPSTLSCCRWYPVFRFDDANNI